MPIIYLTPDDLTAVQAQRVLDALNAVNSAEELAARIEINDELDVGVGVATRILAERSRLDGGFTNLQQVMDVHLVGPERFTEIVQVLADMRLPRFDRAAPVTLDTFQLDRLMRQVSEKIQQYRIEVRLVSPFAFVGQTQEAIIKVINPVSGEGVANVSLTFETHGATLGVSFGFENRYGEVVSSVTGADGSIRIRVMRDTYESLTSSQKKSLEQNLKNWDTSAASPQNSLNDFDALIEAYEHERNNDLRNAIDIYYNDRKSTLSETVNQHNTLFQWPLESVLLRIYVNSADEGDKTVSQTAIQQVCWKNWIAPWFQYYKETLNRRSDLQNRYIFLRDSDSTAFTLVSNILGESQSFIAKQRGIVAEKIAQDIAGNSMQLFLARDIIGLPTDTKRTLFPSLSLAATQIKSSGQGTLSLVTQTRTDLERVVDEKSGTAVLDPALSASIDAVNSRLNTFDSNYSAFNNNLSGFNGDLSSFNSNLSSFNSSLTEFNGDLTHFNVSLQSFNSDYLVFTGNLNAVNNSIAGFNNDLNQFNSDKQSFDANFSRFAVNYGEFESGRAQINTDLGAMRTDLAQANTNLVNMGTQLRSGGVLLDVPIRLDPNDPTRG